MKVHSIAPRKLYYRRNTRFYFFILIVSFSLILSYAFYLLNYRGLNSKDFVATNAIQGYEFFFLGLFVLSAVLIFKLWIRTNLNCYIQVFPDYILINRGKIQEKVIFSEIVSVNFVCWSIFYIKLKTGLKYYFHSRYERVDYIWEGVYKARPDLITPEMFSNYRIKLVQFDHYQKRKEWFLKHKITDLLNWLVLPMVYILSAFFVQSQDIIIHNLGIYFFRLFLFSLLITLFSSFLFTFFLKKFFFDKIIFVRLQTDETKRGDLELEGMVLQRSKIFQMLTTAFLLFFVLKLDLNFYSVTRIPSNSHHNQFHKMKSYIVDNRYNCFSCKYSLIEGDWVVFGKGKIGQIVAKEGEFVGRISRDERGRKIATEDVQKVPKEYVAVNLDQDKAITLIKFHDLIGKLQN